MGGWSPSRFANFVWGLPSIWMILWLGLVALSVALLVLMRTRWGQSQPLRKCAVLSLLAHALLACFATTVKIVNESRGVDDTPSIWVTMAGDDPALPDRDANPSDEPAKPKPWDELTSPALEPLAVAPERRTAGVEAKISRRTTSDTAPSAPKIQSSVRHDADKVVPDSPLLAPEPITRSGPQVAAAEIESAAPERRDSTADDPLPEADARRPVAELEQPAPERKAHAASAESTNDQRQPLPRLARVPRSQHREAALPSIDDLLTQGGTAQPQRGSKSGGPKLPSEISPDGRLAGGALPAPAAPAPPKAAVDGPLEGITGQTAGDIPAVPRLYRQRIADNREQVVQRSGGGRETEAAVEAALAWLAANQEEDGRWDADRNGGGKEQQVFGQQRHAAGAQADTGMTALALLAYLGAGHSHTHGAYQSTVRRGLNFLILSQANDGSLAGRASLFARMYCHGMATLAMSEAYAMTHDERLEPSLLRALQYTISAQHPSNGGWRYQRGDHGDTSQLGWQVMALKSAELAGVRIDPIVRTRALKYLKSVTAGRQGGLARYRPGQPISHAMTAEATFVRQLLGSTTAVADEEAASYLLGALPGEGRHNLYYWYYGTLAMYQVQGDAWRKWNAALKTTLVRSQRAGDELAGSWDPDTVWGGYGGRVYSTSMACLCLEVYYRYLPLYVEARRR